MPANIKLEDMGSDFGSNTKFVELVFNLHYLFTDIFSTIKLIDFEYKVILKMKIILLNPHFFSLHFPTLDSIHIKQITI